MMMELKEYIYSDDLACSSFKEAIKVQKRENLEGDWENILKDKQPDGEGRICLDSR